MVEERCAMATMQIGSYATVSVEWKDANGNPAKVDGPTSWLSSDPGVCEVTVATGNSQIANLFAPGEIGTAQIQATADADMGSGVQAITSTIAVDVISGQATGGEITFTQNSAQVPPTTAKK